MVKQYKQGPSDLDASSLSGILNSGLNVAGRQRRHALTVSLVLMLALPALTAPELEEGRNDEEAAVEQAEPLLVYVIISTRTHLSIDMLL